MESIKSYLVDGGGSGNSDLATMLAMNGGGMNGMMMRDGGRYGDRYRYGNRYDEPEYVRERRRY